MPELPMELRLEGDGVVLRDWTPADGPAIEPVCGDPDICSFTTVPWEYSEGAALAWVERQRRRRESGTTLAMAIEAPGHELPVGTVNLADFDDARRQAEIGYWLVPAARGAGVVTRAARTLIDHGFEALGLRRVEIAILADNRPSHAVAKRLGARPEGTRKDFHTDTDGRVWDMEMYAIER
jgi:RimJ/RimL family protein N-acetyltransferase